jgi:hypothetical protein
MKNKSFILSLILFFFISCNQRNEVKIEYYDTGEIFKTEAIINNHEHYVRLYFKNSNLMQEGMLLDSLKEGSWKAYYSDGVLKGELIFSKNQFVKDIVGHPIILDFKDSPTEIKAGLEYPFRVLNAGQFVIAMPIKILGDYQRLVEDENLPYTYLLVPRKAGTDTIMIITNVYNENIKNDTILFPITVVE